MLRVETAKRKGSVKTRFGLIQTRGRRLSKALEKCLELFPGGESESEPEHSTDAIVVEFVAGDVDPGPPNLFEESSIGLR